MDGEAGWWRTSGGWGRRLGRAVEELAGVGGDAVEREGGRWRADGGRRGEEGRGWIRAVLAGVDAGEGVAGFWETEGEEEEDGTRDVGWRRVDKMEGALVQCLLGEGSYRISPFKVIVICYCYFYVLRTLNLKKKVLRTVHNIAE